MSDGKLEFDTELDTHGMNTELENMGTKAEKATGKFSGLKTAAGKLGDSLKRVVEFSGNVLVNLSSGIFNGANNMAQAGDKIDKMSQKIGISAESYQEWDYVFQRCGTDVGNLQTGMKTLSSVIADAAAGSSAAQKKLAAVGLSIDELNGKSQDEQLSIVIASLQEMGAGAERTSAATDLLGRSATDMGAVLNMTAGETKSLKKEAQDYGMVMSNDAVTASAVFEDSLTKLQGTIGGVKNRLVSDWLPGITQMMDGLSDLISGNRDVGEIFDELTTRIAEQTPKMADAAAEFINSFARSIWNNRKKIITSVRKIIGNIKDKLLELLPPSIRAPIKNAISGVEKALGGIVTVFKNAFTSKGIADAISFVVELIGGIVSTITNVIEKVLPAFQRGFEKIRDALSSEGFKRAISTATDIISTLGDIIGNVASFVIPIICDAISFLMQNLDWLIPLIGTAAGAWGAWKLVNKAAEWCDGFLDKLKKVGDKLSNLGDTLTDTTTKNSGMVSSMLAIPGVQIAAIIGTITAAVAVLTTYLVVNNEEATRIKELAEDVKTSGDAANESAQKVADGFANIGAKAQEFIDGVNNAKSSLEELDGVIDKDRESKLTEQMEGLQKQFNQIAGDYSEERKKLTEEELKSLEDLFAKMRSIADQEVELQMSWQGVTVTQAEMLARDFADSDDYTEKSQEILKGAAESKEKAIEAASKAYNTELLNLNKMYSGEELQAKTKEAYAHYTDNIDAIDRNYDKVVDVINSGNKKVNKARDDFLSDESALYNALRELRESYGRNLKIAGDNQDERLLAQKVYNTETKKLWDQFNDNFSAAQQEELGTWLGYVKNAKENGAQIDEYTAAAVDQFIRTMRMMPPETRATMSDTVSMAESILGSAPQKVQEKAALMTQEWRDGFAAMPGDSRRIAYQTEQAIFDVLGEIPEGGEERARELVKKYAEEINNPYSLVKIKSAAREIADTVEAELAGSGTIGKTSGESVSKNYAEGIADSRNSAAIKLSAGLMTDSLRDELLRSRQIGLNSGRTLADGYAEGIVDSRNSAAIKLSACLMTDSLRDELLRSHQIGLDSGRMLADGYAEGILSANSKIGGVARDMVSAVFGTIKSAQKSNSPSKVARELGGDLSEGYYLGISDNTRKVRSHASDMAGAAIDTIKAMGQRISSMTESARMETGFAAQLKAAALAQAYGVSALLPSGGLRVSAGQSDAGKLVASGNIQTHIDIDGREFAVVTAPYMTEELAFYRG